MIHVKFDRNSGYYYTNMLHTEKYISMRQSEILNKNRKVIKHKKKTNEKTKVKFKKFKGNKQTEESIRNEKIIEKKQDNIVFKQSKKEFNELIKSGIETNTIIENGVYNDSNFVKVLVSNNKVLNTIINDNYNRALKFDTNLNKNKIITDFKIPKWRQLQLLQLNNCGSTQNLTNSANPEDYYNMVKQYMECKNNNKLIHTVFKSWIEYSKTK